MSKPSNIYLLYTYYQKRNEKWFLFWSTRLGNSNCCSWIIPHLSLLPLPYICCVWGSEVRKLLCTHFLELDQKRLMSLAQITTCPDHKSNKKIQVWGLLYSTAVPNSQVECPQYWSLMHIKWNTVLASSRRGRTYINIWFGTLM